MNNLAPLEVLIRNTIAQHHNKLAQLALALAQDREYISPEVPSELTFEIFLESYWANSGGKDVTVTARTTLNDLEKLAAEAIETFKKVNNHPYVRADWYVSVILPSGTKISLPREYWGYIERSD